MLISGGTVIDGTGQEPMPAHDVLVHGDLIVDVAPSIDVDAAVPRGESVERIDGTGKTVMPGLIDAHCHTSFGEVRLQEEQCLYTSHELRVIRSTTNLPRILRAGVTSISVPGGSYFIDVGLREGVKEKILQGPRMACASRFISSETGIGAFYPSSVGNPEGSVGKIANTTDQMVTEVLFQVKGGVDLIKIADSNLGQYESFSRDQIKAMSDAAHRHNKKVTIHARGSKNVDSAIAAEVDWIMHANVMTDDTIERLAESGIPLCPVLLLLANILDFGEIIGVPAEKRENYKRLLDQAGEIYHKAKQAGVTFITGTDSGFAHTPFGEWHARELELLVTYAGLTPLEAIRAATADCAVTLCGIEDVGSIKAGKGADILVVNGDPSKDVRVLQNRANLEHVISRGQVLTFDEEALKVRHPYDRAKHIAPGEVLYDAVFGDADAAVLSELGMSDEQARDLLHDLKAAGGAIREGTLP
jgi:imidazolonepropionase-like amidohydrolase